jgi:hypothetical protein
VLTATGLFGCGVSGFTETIRDGFKKINTGEERVIEQFCAGALLLISRRQTNCKENESL